MCFCHSTPRGKVRVHFRIAARAGSRHDGRMYKFSYSLLTVLAVSCVLLASCSKQPAPTPELIVFQEAEAKALAGDKEAQFAIARMYWEGHGSETNATKGYYWMTKAAGQGHLEAIHDAAMANLHGFGTTTNKRAALQLYLKAADRGHMKAQTAIGIALQEGRFGLKQDHKKANEYLSFAAQQGYTPAFLNLAKAHFYGWGTDQDHVQAFKWMSVYVKSAKASPEAWHIMAIMYQRGVGTERDEKKAFNIELRLAYSGYNQAQALVSVMYHEGMGTDTNLAHAYAWAVVAASSGNEKYRALAEEYAEEVTPTERSLAGAILPQIKKKMIALANESKSVAQTPDAP